VWNDYTLQQKQEKLLAASVSIGFSYIKNIVFVVFV
jgi:hypothetical protein